MPPSASQDSRLLSLRIQDLRHHPGRRKQYLCARLSHHSIPRSPSAEPNSPFSLAVRNSSEVPRPLPLQTTLVRRRSNSLPSSPRALISVGGTVPARLFMTKLASPSQAALESPVAGEFGAGFLSRPPPPATLPVRPIVSVQAQPQPKPQPQPQHQPQTDIEQRLFNPLGLNLIPDERNEGNAGRLHNFDFVPVQKRAGRRERASKALSSMFGGSK
ncbi:hypothetical protein BT69DRAFT_784985 [Atractiella rhizophila]|nr:hypothetical protein BT69DRAFT_784985 [Atractiella rhizophila]